MTSSYRDNGTVESMSSASTKRALSLSADSRLFYEINLLRLEGYYFCFDKHEARCRTDEQYEFLEMLKHKREVLGEHPVVILAHPRYGYPSAQTYKVLHGIVRKLSRYGYPVPDTVYFSQRELARLAGRKSYGGKDKHDFYMAIKQLEHTEISCFFYDKESGEWKNVNFTILITTIFSGKKEAITECYVQLHPLIIKSLNSRYALCLNYDRMDDLPVIAIALYKRLFYHIANLYSDRLRNKSIRGERQKKRFSYTKDYADVCTQWLGGLKVHRYRSKILADQLGPFFKALEQKKLIESYAVDKNAKGDGFNLTFTPGTGFFEDYRQFYARYLQIEMPFEKTPPVEQGETPLALVAAFYNRLYPAGTPDEMVFSDSETALARTLLETYSFDELQDLIAFTLTRAQETHFAIQTFGGMKNFINGWLEVRAKRQTKRKREQEQEAAAHAKHLRDQYNAYITHAVAELKLNMQPDDLALLTQEVRAQLIEDGKTPHFALDSMVRVGTENRLAEQYLLSFEEWAQQHKVEIPQN